MKRLLSVFAAIGCSLAAVPKYTLAQANSGFTLFGGPQRGYELSYHLARGRADVFDRYELKIPGDRLNSPVTEIAIDYPDYYKGKFNTEKVEVVVGNEERTLQCQEMPDTEAVNPSDSAPDTEAVNLSDSAEVPPCSVRWNPEAQSIQIKFTEPVAARTNLELVFDGVKNPVFGTMFNFNCRVSTLTGQREPQYIGTWVLSID